MQKLGSTFNQYIHTRYLFSLSGLLSVLSLGHFIHQVRLHIGEERLEARSLKPTYIHTIAMNARITTTVVTVSEYIRTQKSVYMHSYINTYCAYILHTYCTYIHAISVLTRDTLRVRMRRHWLCALRL